MSRITIVVYKSGLALEAGLHKLTREIQKKKGIGYKAALIEAEKEFDYVQYTQVIHSNSIEIDYYSLGAHVAGGAPHSIDVS